MAKGYGGGNGAWGFLLYAVIGWFIYKQKYEYAPLPGQTVGTGGVTYWIRADDGLVVASPTGPPTSDMPGGWGTWSPASTAEVRAALDAGGMQTVS